MNGKYMRWAEIRWNDRNDSRLEKMAEKKLIKEKKQAMKEAKQNHGGE